MADKTGTEIEAEIYRRIKKQSPNDSHVVLQGDRRWLLERLDELEAKQVPQHIKDDIVTEREMAEVRIDELKQDLTTARSDVERLIEQLTDDLVCLPEHDYDACDKKIDCSECWHKWLQERP